MKTWEEIFCKAKEIGAAAGRKATDVADTARLKVRLAENDRAVESTMEALGRLLYDSHRCGSPIDEEIAGELYQQADELLKAADDLQAQIDAKHGDRTCPACGGRNPAEAQYCNHCGKKL